ncbi:MAG: hypothetical protein HY557_00025 [Euryarchaeota archaeon]|nr:hypothetical protein [Euryarchaeota archaeon]
METYWALLRDGISEEEATRIVESFESLLLDFSFPDIRAALALRLRWHRRGTRISYVDAIGYHLARSHGLRFLTGDPAFRGATGVTFLGLGRRG